VSTSAAKKINKQKPMNNIAWPETERHQFLYVGMDIHKDNHTAVATNCFGQNLLEMEISNSQKDFDDLIARVERLSRAENLKPILGLEDIYGYGLRLARHLYNKGLSVKMIAPVLVDRERRYETHPEKSDSLDALGVAKVLIQRIDKLPNYSISKNDEISKNIKELSLDREFLIKEQSRLKNQLHRLLHKAYNSEYREKFRDPFSLKALKFWRRYSLSGKKNENTDHILNNQIRRKIKRLLAIREEIKEIEQELKLLLWESGQKIETLNGCGVVSASQVLAEIRNIDRFHSPHSLAKYAGLCPREKSSGKTFRHIKTKSGNRRLNMAVHRIALSQISRSGNQYAKAYFQRKISEGKTKVQALCCLKRRLIDIIFMMLKYKQAYNYIG
jgi:transposase